jgi:dipeptidyl aminopeptidase/acylaminoacyl peptidase
MAASLFLTGGPPALLTSSLPQGAPVIFIGDEVAAFQFSPDGRLAYAIRRTITSRRIEMQRDDIYVLWNEYDKKRIVNGEKLVKGNVPFSYAIQSLRWSPDGSKLTVEMLTSVMTDRNLNTKDSFGTFLVDQQGKEIFIAGEQSLIEEATGAAWLSDEATVGFLREEVQPKLLFGLYTIRPGAGSSERMFENTLFAAVAWNRDPKAPPSAVAIERNRTLSGPITLVWLDIAKQSRREIARIGGYFGELTLSPSGSKAAYFTDPNTLEVRDVENPELVLRLKLPIGSFQWSRDERRILWKRPSPEVKRAGTLAWVTIPELPKSTTPEGPQPIEATPAPFLGNMSVRDFALTAGNRHVAVSESGTRNLRIFRLD